jgi:hypothetical protein
MADISALSYFVPVAVFLLVFIVLFAILHKVKILGDNKWVQLFVSLIIASLFITLAGTVEYVRTVVPWIAVLIVSLVFVLLITGIIGKPMEFMNKGIGITFFIVIILILIISAFVVFSNVIGPYLPWNSSTPSSSQVTSVIYSSRVVGAVILIAVSALVAFILTKK